MINYNKMTKKNEDEKAAKSKRKEILKKCEEEQLHWNDPRCLKSKTPHTFKRKEKKLKKKLKKCKKRRNIKTQTQLIL